MVVDYGWGLCDDNDYKETYNYNEYLDKIDQKKFNMYVDTEILNRKLKIYAILFSLFNAILLVEFYSHIYNSGVLFLKIPLCFYFGITCSKLVIYYFNNNYTNIEMYDFKHIILRSDEYYLRIFDKEEYLTNVYNDASDKYYNLLYLYKTYNNFEKNNKPKIKVKQL